MVQDQFAIGRSAAMTAYADLFTGFDRYYAAGHRFHPETYFRWFIASAGLHIDEADISLELDLRGVRWREDRAIY